MTATKEQERKALEKIRKIVNDLGEDSYIGIALEGCFDIAEDNIKNDEACSMKQRYENAEDRAARFREKANGCEAQAKRLEAQVRELEAVLEDELEWRPYEDKDNVQQADYEKLAHDEDTRVLTDDEAKDLLYDWYGFAKECVRIIHSVPKKEVNRHKRLRDVGSYDRRPLYNATDWNYIRFDCAGMSYELDDDTLRFY